MAWIPEPSTVFLALGAVLLAVSIPYLQEFVRGVYEQYWRTDIPGPDELEEEFDLSRSTSSGGSRYDSEPTHVVCCRCSAENDLGYSFCRQCTRRLRGRVSR